MTATTVQQHDRYAAELRGRIRMHGRSIGACVVLYGTCVVLLNQCRRISA
jgi:hypothetical protein